ncbi:MAG: hypothetical protein DMF24_08035 [Verrucomicrobia bacterium]|nr:MAG: hypothetical protein DME90_08590 [Verrucomicrobiota bacterium]PYL61180.1 MAG: hypothetical protein DMF24_08035 [Verrucomicrobiota bacterium]
MRSKPLILAAAIAIVFLLVAAGGVAVFYSPLVTHYVESESFRRAMEGETAKGLHFPHSNFAPIRRTSAFTAYSESFGARDGEKAMKSLDGHGITATFDPLGVFIRQWRFTDVRVQSGDVEIQIYKANPEAIAPKPWFSIFLPNRVYLKKIESGQANITWQFRGEQAGFFGTQLLITPHGPDFEYVATSGRLKMALLPDLALRRAHLLITKTLFTIYDSDLASDAGSSESIRAQAHAGIGKDRSVDLRANFNQVPIRAWLPVEWKKHFNGSASGDFHWAGKDPKLESSSGEGSLRVSNGRIDNLPVLEKLAELAQNKSFEHLELNNCSLSFEWKYPRIDISNIAIEERGKFRVEGEMSIEQRRLHGTIRFGLTREYLDWLPNPEEVFSRSENGYFWTHVHLFGTIDDPGQDLSSRIIELFNQSPGAYLGLLFRQFEGWLKRGFGDDH